MFCQRSERGIRPLRHLGLIHTPVSGLSLLCGGLLRDDRDEERITISVGELMPRQIRAVLDRLVHLEAFVLDSIKILDAVENEGFQMYKSIEHRADLAGHQFAHTDRNAFLITIVSQETTAK